MASVGMQMIGSSLALLGWVGILLTCILPMWRVTAFIGMTIVTSETMWEGIWMSCVIQSTGHMQCKAYDSMLSLSSDLKAAQVLIVGSLMTGALGLILAFIGGKCTRFMDYQSDVKKRRVATAAGVTLSISGLLCLVPVSWTAATVVQLFYNPLINDSQRREIGAAIYVGWGASILLLLGGGMLCSTACSKKAEDVPVKYMSTRSFKPGSSIANSQQVRIPQPAHDEHLLARSQWSDQPSANQRRNRNISERSMLRKPSSTKSQLEKTVIEYEPSESLSTKSQLIRAASEQSLQTSEISDATSGHVERTYI